MRLVIALSVAAALAVFLLYTSFAGGATPSLKPSQLAGHRGKLSVSGYVLGPVKGDPHTTGGLRFKLRDIDGPHENVHVAVVFHGSEPDLFRAGRHVYVVGNGGSATNATHFACDLSKATIVEGRARLRVAGNDRVGQRSASAIELSLIPATRTTREEIVNPAPTRCTRLGSTARSSMSSISAGTPGTA